MKKLLLICACLVGLVAGPSANAASYTYTFARITSNSEINVASQLSVNVAPTDLGTVDFKFLNVGSVPSSICDIYFDDGTLLAIATITSGTGVAFGTPATPGDLPGGNLASPPFVTTANFSADSYSPAAPNGVNPGEWVTINFSLKDSMDFDDTIDALKDGGLRIGLHVQAIGEGEDSDAFVNVPPAPPQNVVVPDGGVTAVLLGLGMLGVGILRLKLD